MGKRTGHLDAASSPRTRCRDEGRALPSSAGPFGVSETCYRYGPKLWAENEEIADLLVGLTNARKTWGFELCFLYLRNVNGHSWSYKRVYLLAGRRLHPNAVRRIYFALELDLRIKPRKRLKRDKPDALAVLEAPNMTWSMECAYRGPSVHGGSSG